ncbi:hypothetical protein GA0074696_4078 [Micromonospora purpureochromogenes]|uniref:Uncharacterized protein n=2 Tax=Micromonospora purpureochromogenes TaxID=47872 RepID=A0A1C4Z663_9ACTN|nr:hypothetical protein GA0074696_4078 [Micromonospora purpureochromogenes]
MTPFDAGGTPKAVSFYTTRRDAIAEAGPSGIKAAKKGLPPERRLSPSCLSTRQR